MRSALGTLARAVSNKTPVPYAPRRSGLFNNPAAGRGDQSAQLAAMGSVGTLFAIVSRSSTATSMVHWDLFRTSDGRSQSAQGEQRPPVESHAALDLWRKPNAHMTGQKLVEITQQHIDLVGEGYWVVVRARGVKLPLELWPVRPDRMIPVPSATEFLAGWLYCGPDGDKIPLDTDDVVTFHMPDPESLYRGMGPVQAILADLDSARYSAEWNRNFFVNSAEPGGIIELDKRLDDDEWTEFTSRWREQHQGVAQAHRVAVLEHGGKWVDRKFSMRDMQFEQLRNVSRDIIREAFGFSKTMLGQTEDVNRATAEAAEYVFSKWHLIPRLERYKGAWDNDLLPMYGNPGSLEMCYEDPVPEDAEAEREDRDSRVNAAVALIEAGADPEETLEAFALPKITFRSAGAPGQASPPEGVEGFAAALHRALNNSRRRRPRRPAPRGQDDDEPAGDPAHGLPRHLPASEQPDLAPLQDSWEQALDDLLDEWADLEATQKDDLVDRARDIIEDGDLGALTELEIGSDTTAAALEAAMVAIAAEAAGQLADEAAEQGAEVTPVDGDVDLMGEVAVVVAAVRASVLVGSATVTAIRANGPDATPETVADAVRDNLDGLSADGPRPLLGGALTGAQNEGRIATLRTAPEAALYSNEVNDTNTCGPCREVDGRWLGNISDIDQVLSSYPGGAYGGYIACLGRERCRGTITGVWRSEQTSDG